jgi:hypothetical protein
MTTTRKILAINHLNNDDLPKEVTEIINSFVFHDIEHINIRIKQQRDRTQQSLSKSKYYPSDINGHWGIQILDALPDGYSLQLQPVNCKKCGNYKESFTNVKLHHNTNCNCL